jgi:hypothetical protein
MLARGRMIMAVKRKMTVSEFLLIASNLIWVTILVEDDRLHPFN